MTRYLKHARLLGGALALIVGLTLVVPPAFAAEAAAVADPRPIAAAAAAKVEAIPAASLAQAAQATPATAPAEAGDKTFFKTTKGVVALVLLGGVLGYTAYAFSNDRVNSPQR